MRVDEIYRVMRFTTHHRGKAHGACKYAATGKVQYYYLMGEVLKNAPWENTPRTAGKKYR